MIGRDFLAFVYKSSNKRIDTPEGKGILTRKFVCNLLYKSMTFKLVMLLSLPALLCPLYTTFFVRIHGTFQDRIWLCAISVLERVGICILLFILIISPIFFPFLLLSLETQRRMELLCTHFPCDGPSRICLCSLQIYLPRIVRVTESAFTGTFILKQSILNTTMMDQFNLPWS